MPQKFEDTISVDSQGTWASLIPYRGPQWKVHTKKSHAANAVGRIPPRQAWALYELRGDTWHKVAANELPLNCPRCDADFRQVYEAVKGYEPRYYDNDGRFFDPKNEGPNWQREIICIACRDRAQQ